MGGNVSIIEHGIGLHDILVNTRKLNGKKINVGVLRTAGRSADGKTDLVDIAMWNEFGTARIPKRPFMRIAEEKHGKEWQKLATDLADKVDMGEMNEEQLYEIVGNKMVGDIQEVIGNRNQLQANAPATVRRKKSDAPLIDTGQLRQAISFEVR